MWNFSKSSGFLYFDGVRLQDCGLVCNINMIIVNILYHSNNGWLWSFSICFMTEDIESHIMVDSLGSSFVRLTFQHLRNEGRLIETTTLLFFFSLISCTLLVQR